MKNQLTFRIVTSNPLKLTFLSREDMISFPTFEMHCKEFHEKFITFYYRPAKGFQTGRFTNLLIRKLKKKYNAVSVEIMEPAPKLKSVSS